jgi:multidrug efflux pump subunit AcrA (membrane-fusion protein)
VQIQDQADDAFDAWQTMDSISARIEAEIAQHLGKMNVDAATQREIDRALRRAEQELAQAQRQLDIETERARERARRAQSNAAKAAKRAQERIARRSRSWGVTIDTESGLFGPPHPRHSSHRRPHPPRASAEEQLAILKMLQEGKISVQEAEELLRALEG